MLYKYICVVLEHIPILGKHLSCHAFSSGTCTRQEKIYRFVAPKHRIITVVTQEFHISFLPIFTGKNSRLISTSSQVLRSCNTEHQRKVMDLKTSKYSALLHYLGQVSTDWRRKQLCLLLRS
jgi:hypothetical protein